MAEGQFIGCRVKEVQAALLQLASSPPPQSRCPLLTVSDSHPSLDIGHLRGESGCRESEGVMVAVQERRHFPRFGPAVLPSKHCCSPDALCRGKVPGLSTWNTVAALLAVMHAEMVPCVLHVMDNSSQTPLPAGLTYLRGRRRKNV